MMRRAPGGQLRPVRACERIGTALQVFPRKIGFAAIQEIAANDELGISPAIFGDTLEHAVDGRHVEGVVGCIGQFVAHHLAETDRLGCLVSQLGAKVPRGRFRVGPCRPAHRQ